MSPIVTIPILGKGMSTSLEIMLQVRPEFMGGMITNNAEITSAVTTNPLHNSLEDEDNPLSVIHGSIDDVSELATDNDVDDETGFPSGDPVNGDNANDVDDYDLAQIEIGQMFDLAIRKTFDPVNYVDNDMNGVISPGDDVTFDIEVFNQGTLDAYNVQLSDYIPGDAMMRELILNDAAWEDDDMDGVANLVTVIPFIAASTTSDPSVMLTITFTIDPMFMGTLITNFVEISAADDDTDSTNPDPIDIDSTPDNEMDNDIQGPDNSIDNEQNDEDDHDPAPVTVVQEFDLALIKTINSATPGPYYPGSMVTFDITVFNQGGLDAYDIQINDYFPSDLILTDTDWSLNGNTATMVNEIPYIAADDSETVMITFMIR